ncbi:MAG: hypothetical protein ACE15F_19265 [bacterium]
MRVVFEQVELPIRLAVFEDSNDFVFSTQASFGLDLPGFHFHNQDVAFTEIVSSLNAYDEVGIGDLSVEFGIAIVEFPYKPLPEGK